MDNVKSWSSSYGDRFLLNDKGNIHSINGPAIFWSDGRVEYWIDGEIYTEEDYPKAVFEYKLKQIVG